MIEFTTVPQVFFIPEHYLSDADIYVTYRDRNRKLILTIKNVIVTELEDKGSYLEFELTQQQTSLFSNYKSIDVQVNWIKDDKRYATKIKTIPVYENLIKEVLPIVETES